MEQRWRSTLKNATNGEATHGASVKNFPEAACSYDPPMPPFSEAFIAAMAAMLARFSVTGLMYVFFMFFPSR